MLNNDFKEFAELFNANGVEYLVVGGYALAAFGHPRYTGDLDFWVGASATNAQRVHQCLIQFGFGSLGISADDFSKPDQIVQLGRPPARIDILTSIDGVDFDACFERREVFVFGTTTMNFISRADFVINKRAAGRQKDWADIESLGLKP